MMHGRGNRHGSRSRRRRGGGGGGGCQPGEGGGDGVGADDPEGGGDVGGRGSGGVLVLQTELGGRLSVGVGLQQLCLRCGLFQVRS